MERLCMHSLDQSLSPHISIPFLSHTHSRSRSIGGYTDKPGLEWSSSTSTTLELGPKSLLLNIFSPTRSKSCSFCKHSYIFATGKTVSLLEFSWEQNLIIPSAWQVLAQFDVTSSPEPSLAFTKLNRKLWQKWEMGPIFMKIRMTPEELFVLWHRFGLARVLLLKK